MVSWDLYFILQEYIICCHNDCWNKLKLGCSNWIESRWTTLKEVFGEDMYILRTQGHTKHVNVSHSYLFLKEMYVSLDMLDLLMLNGVREKVNSYIVTLNDGCLIVWAMKFKRQVAKPTSLNCCIGDASVFNVVDEAYNCNPRSTKRLSM